MPPLFFNECIKSHLSYTPAQYIIKNENNFEQTFC